MKRTSVTFINSLAAIVPVDMYRLIGQYYNNQGPVNKNIDSPTPQQSSLHNTFQNYDTDQEETFPGQFNINLFVSYNQSVVFSERVLLFSYSGEPRAKTTAYILWKPVFEPP